VKWLIIAGVLALVVVGFLFFRLPQPILELRAETLFSIGPVAITNTILTSWVMVALISLITILGTRKLTLVPTGWFQNLFEALIEGFGNIVNGVAGEQNGRRFFPVVFILFFYIVFCNWMALTPLFNVIGTTENVYEHVHHLAADPEHADEPFEEPEIQGWVMKHGSFNYLPLGEKTEHVKVEIPEHSTNAQAAALMDAELEHTLGHPFDEEHETYGLIAPFLRGVNTDLNAPLGYAVWSAIFVELWGITALGLLAYGSKFFNFKGGPIGIFVGLLELISEFARLISFTFRLFGNIFAGEVLLFMMSFLLPFVLVDAFYGLELFVGLIQGFVFAMLTLVFGVMAVSGHGDHEEHHAEPHTAPAEHHA